MELVQSASWTRRPFWDVGCGNDCEDQKIAFWARQADQGDLPGTWTVAESCAQGDPFGGERVSL